MSIFSYEREVFLAGWYVGRREELEFGATTGRITWVPMQGMILVLTADKETSCGSRISPRSGILYQATITEKAEQELFSFPNIAASRGSTGGTVLEFKSFGAVSLTPFRAS